MEARIHPEENTADQPVFSGDINKFGKQQLIATNLEDDSEKEISKKTWFDNLEPTPLPTSIRSNPIIENVQVDSEGENEKSTRTWLKELRERPPLPSISIDSLFASASPTNTNFDVLPDDAGDFTLSSIADDTNPSVEQHKIVESVVAETNSPESPRNSSNLINDESSNKTSQQSIVPYRSRMISVRNSNTNSRRYLISERIKKTTITEEELDNIASEITTKSLDELDKFDGEILGALIWSLRNKTRKNRKGDRRHNGCVRILIEKNKGLVEIVGKHQSFYRLLEGMMNNSLYCFPTSTGKLILSNLNDDQASIIGMKFSNGLRSRGSSEAGTQQWISQHLALVELDNKYPFFSTMCNTIGQRKLREALWGMKFRLYSGAALTLLDSATDINAIYTYFVEGRDIYGWTNLAFILVSLLLQFVIVIVQNRKRGVKVVVREIAIVVLMIKAPIDAKRVASGNIQEELCLFDPQMEYTYTKCADMFGEGIPSSILQTYALLDDGMSATAVVSIVISAASIAFSSTTISIEYDTAPRNRLYAANYYGYFPDKYRSFVFAFMFTMTTCHVVMKVLACSLIMHVKKEWFMYYMSSDMAVYFCFKFVRSDFIYWLPIEGALALALSGIIRLVIKNVVDFTLLIQFRHPFELSGAYWSFNLVSQQLGCFVAIYLSSNEFDEEFVVKLWITVFLLFIVSMINFGGFLSLINRKYFNTFFDTRTGRRFAIDNFLGTRSLLIK